MGMQLEELPSIRILDPSRSLVIDQLARTKSSSPCIEDFSNSTELDDSDTYGQHNQPPIHQQARWHLIPTTPRTSTRSLELVPRPQYNDPSTAHQRDQQHHSGFRVLSNILQEPVADFTSKSTNSGDLSLSISLPTAQPNCYQSTYPGCRIQMLPIRMPSPSHGQLYRIPTQILPGI